MFYHTIVKDDLPPERYRRGLKALASGMAIGDSVRLKTRSEVSNLRATGHALNMKMSVRKRKTPEGTVYWQMWRIT